MDRETLTEEVKGEYASLAQQETQQHFVQTTSRINPEEYYENILGMVLTEISAGTFDNFQSGKAVVDAVARDKHKWLSQWNESKGAY